VELVEVVDEIVDMVAIVTLNVVVERVVDDAAGLMAWAVPCKPTGDHPHTKGRPGHTSQGPGLPHRERCRNTNSRCELPSLRDVLHRSGRTWPFDSASWVVTNQQQQIVDPKEGQVEAVAEAVLPIPAMPLHTATMDALALPSWA